MFFPRFFTFLHLTCDVKDVIQSQTPADINWMEYLPLINNIFPSLNLPGKLCPSIANPLTFFFCRKQYDKEVNDATKSSSNPKLRKEFYPDSRQAKTFNNCLRQPSMG